MSDLVGNTEDRYSLIWCGSSIVAYVEEIFATTMNGSGPRRNIAASLQESGYVLPGRKFIPTLAYCHVIYSKGKNLGLVLKC